MARLKTYTIEHHQAIAASRREVREAVNRVKKADTVPAKSGAAKRKASVKQAQDAGLKAEAE